MQHSINRFIYLLLFVSFFMTLPALAGPARKGFFTRTQPDGTEIRLQLVGDELAHAFATPDGKLMRREADGFFRAFSESEERASSPQV